MFKLSDCRRHMHTEENIEYLLTEKEGQSRRNLEYWENVITDEKKPQKKT
jgi:hypothetical protein